MTRRVVGTVVAALAVVTGVTWAQNFGSSQVDRYFRVEWELGPSGRGPVVAGYLHNDRGLWATNVRLLVEELNGTGRPVTRILGYVAGDVPPNGRAYFEVPVPRAAVTYRVTVDAFDWLVGGPSG